MRVLPLAPGHLADVAELEQLCFPEEPWSEQALLVLCRDHGTGYAAVNEDGQVLAYVGMTYAADEGSITNVATHPDARRQGLGRAVVEALLAKAASLDLAFVYLEVRPSNAAAIALYQSLGFTLVGRRKNFYRHPTEDALLMQVDPSRGTSPKKD
jgi:ribosomal-protein-alanine N-acetyltransferase